ncbi:sporulation integral membrane protein YlbJ [Bacillaceae bacterium Marseille-Q3522]|nr:sporulation integral membrane protein YlbJ [Bacillaceae bacterium Marseille-Q3522]
MFQSRIKTVFLASICTILAASLIAYPRESVQASIRGLNMWWEIVFPSLLPFFIVSELLISFGVVAFIGVLLEPLMRPLFKVPGVGGFVWTMGMASGYPSGAKFTARLRQEKQLTKIEAERLVSFTNASNPLFIIGAVSVGFFNNPQLGILLAIAHYTGNFTVGLLMRFYGKEEKSTKKKKQPAFSFREALASLHRTRINDNRPIGKLLGDAVTSSVQSLLMIGGFIILFSVINKLLYLLHITDILSAFIQSLLIVFHLPPELSISLISGLFEITLGTQMTSQVSQVSLMHQAIIASLILGFCGFSVQAQVASILAQTDIQFKPFFFARMLHALLAALYTFLLWKPVYLRINANNESQTLLPAFQFTDVGLFHSIFGTMSQIGPIVTLMFLSLYIIIYSYSQYNR